METKQVVPLFYIIEKLIPFALIMADFWNFILRSIVAPLKFQNIPYTV
jgi:hypothetical protein